MLFHKNYIMKTLFVLLFSVKIITASNRSDFGHQTDASNNTDENDEDISDYSSSSTSEDDTVTISDGVTKEVFLNFPACWESLKDFCEVEIPRAVHFAKAVIRKWKEVEVFIYHYPSEYYNEFESYLDADKILPPNVFCAKLVSGTLSDDNEDQEAEASDTEYTSSDEEDEKVCQVELSSFGGTSETALKHCFFDIITIELLPYVWEGGQQYEESEPNDLIRSLLQLSLSNDKYYTHQYMMHMSKKVDVKPEIISPLRFCKKMEEKELKNSE